MQGSQPEGDPLSLIENQIWPLSKYNTDFETLEKIGEGKFGRVHRARRRGSSSKDEIRAVKFIHCKKASQKLRIREEIDILRLLGPHPHLIQLIGAYEDSGNFVQVLEYLPGGELFERIIESHVELSETDIADLIRQICEGLKMCMDTKQHLLNSSLSTHATNSR